MTPLKDFQIQDKIYESARTTVYYAKQKQSDDNVIIKTISKHFPSLAEINKFKKEFEILEKLQSKGVIEVIGLTEKDGKHAIIMKDFGGTPLNTILKKRKLELKKVLSLAISIAESLDFIHQNKIIHKDINPSNILVNETTNKVKIIDFGLSVEHNQLNLESENIKFIEGTLPYIAPEQTGRINKAIDYRC